MNERAIICSHLRSWPRKLPTGGTDLTREKWAGPPESPGCWGNRKWLARIKIEILSHWLSQGKGFWGNREAGGRRGSKEPMRAPVIESASIGIHQGQRAAPQGPQQWQAGRERLAPACLPSCLPLNQLWHRWEKKIPLMRGHQWVVVTLYGTGHSKYSIERGGLCLSMNF